MKKSLVYLLTIAAAMIFTACAGKTDAMDPTAGKKTEQAADKAVPEQGSETATAQEAPVAEESAVEAAAEEKVTEEAAEVGVESMAVYFDFDKFNIRDDMVSVVEDIAGKLKVGHANDTIKLEGNCDEWGTDEYNYALGLRRAKSVKDTLVAHGVSEANLKLISYGESNPTCTEKNEACWSKNRRVEFKINQ